MGVNREQPCRSVGGVFGGTLRKKRRAFVNPARFAAFTRKPSAAPFMNRTQFEHIIRAASRISDDGEIVVIGSQAIHAQEMKLLPIAYISERPTCTPATTPNAPTILILPLASLTIHGHEVPMRSSFSMADVTQKLPWRQQFVILRQGPNT
jgi:hypothetical protein